MTAARAVRGAVALRVIDDADARCGVVAARAVVALRAAVADDAVRAPVAVLDVVALRAAVRCVVALRAAVADDAARWETVSAVVRVVATAGAARGDEFCTDPALRATAAASRTAARAGTVHAKHAIKYSKNFFILDISIMISKMRF